MNTPETKTAFVAIVGCPNVGKSSLLNRMIGQKVAIVTSKPQTTRTRIMGVLTLDETQLVFTDTPGYHRPHNKLGEKMNQAVSDSISGVDACLFVVEPRGELRPEEQELLRKFRQQDMPVVLAINKIDTVENKQDLALRISSLSALYNFTAVVPVCAVKGDGVDELLQELTALAEPSVHYFPDDALTDQPERVIAAEIIREKMLRLEPQGHYHWQEGRHAQEDFHVCPRGHGEVLRLPGEPALLGQGQRRVAGPRLPHPQLRPGLKTHRTQKLCFDRAFLFAVFLPGFLLRTARRPPTEQDSPMASQVEARTKTR